MPISMTCPCGAVLRSTGVRETCSHARGEVRMPAPDKAPGYIQVVVAVVGHAVHAGQALGVGKWRDARAGARTFSADTACPTSAHWLPDAPLNPTASGGKSSRGPV